MKAEVFTYNTITSPSIPILVVHVVKIDPLGPSMGKGSNVHDANNSCGGNFGGFYNRRL